MRQELAREQAKRRKGRNRVIGTAAAAVVIGGVFLFVLPRIADYRDVWDVIQGITWQWILGLAFAVTINVVTSAPPGWPRCQGSDSCMRSG